MFKYHSGKSCDCMVKQGHLNVLITWKSYYVECSITFLLLIRKKYFDWNVYYYNILSGKNKYYVEEMYIHRYNIMW